MKEQRSTRMRIGLSLSGGGFRATVFHLGVLARLAEEERLEDVAFLSTVSGGSLCAGLVYACSGYRWPASRELTDEVIPRARQLLTSTDLQSSMMWRVLRVPSRVFGTRADDLSLLLQKHWGITGQLCALAEHPRWMINATCYETGKNFRFERGRMGDYVLGYTADTDIPLSDALSASAAFPGLIGPLKLDTRNRSWFKYQVSYKEGGDVVRTQVEGEDRERGRESTRPRYSRLHLWDGGVYDNLGLEGLHNFDEGWRQDVDFLVTSDGCGKLKPETYRPWKAANRLIRGIMMDQVRSLRFRALSERRTNHRDAGCYLQIGHTSQEILRTAGRDDEEAVRLGSRCLTAEEATRAATMSTTIRRLTPEEFERLFRHGFEVADSTLYAGYPETFSYVGYANVRFRQRTPKSSRWSDRAYLRGSSQERKGISVAA